MTRYCWARKDPGGYEVSSKGDTRFSAFYATMPDGRSLEEWYQCDVKGYEPGGTSWRLGKGKPSKIEYPGDQLWEMYLNLWRLWVIRHPAHFTELARLAAERGGVLTDMFASGEINQARALSMILNEWS